MNYKKVLEQRNNLLKQISFDRSKADMLSVWDAQLLKYGIEIKIINLKGCINRAV